MRRSRVLRVGAVIAGAILMLSACSGGGDDEGVRTGAIFADCDTSPNTCNSADRDELQQGGSVAYALEKNIENWNLLSFQGNVFEHGLVLRSVLPATYYTQPDLTPALNEDLLESVEMTDTSPQKIVYRIKDEASWSDGTPITANDFIYNWKVQNGRDCPDCTSASTAGYDQIQSVVGSDEAKTVTVTYATPFADWKSMWGSGSPLYPAHIAAQHGSLNTPGGLAESFAWFETNVPAFSGGPFQIDNFQNNDSVILVPNPEWYGQAPNLDRLIFRIVPDATQGPIALQNNKVQVIYSQPQVGLVQQVRNIPNVSSYLGLGLTWEHYDLNLENPFLAAEPLRDAIFTAVDRQAIIDKTVGQFTDKVEPLNNHNFRPEQDGYTDVVTEFGQGAGDVERAKQILTDAGYRIAEDQLITPDGTPVPPMRIRYTTGNQIRQTECELFVQQVKPLGLNVQVVPTDTLGETTDQGDYDIIVFAWVTNPFPYSSAVQLWTTGSARNYGNYSNPEVDRLIREAVSSTDEVAAAEKLNQANRIIAEDSYVLPLYQNPMFIALYENVANVRNNSTLNGPTYNTEEWGLRTT